MTCIRLNGRMTDLPGPVVSVRDIVTIGGKDHRTHYLRERIDLWGSERWINHNDRTAVLDCRRDEGKERVFETRRA